MRPEIYLEDTVPLINILLNSEIGDESIEESVIEDLVGSLIDYSVHKEEGEPAYCISDPEHLEIARSAFGFSIN